MYNEIGQKGSVKIVSTFIEILREHSDEVNKTCEKRNIKFDYHYDDVWDHIFEVTRGKKYLKRCYRNRSYGSESIDTILKVIEDMADFLDTIKADGVFHIDDSLFMHNLPLQ